MNRKIRITGAALSAALWLALAVFAWGKPAADSSDAERRKLAQFPELSVKTVLSGKFMTNFEDYTLDQFPLRDTFRQLKAVFHYHVLGQKDNNDIFLYDGHAAQLDYSVDEKSVQYALDKFRYLYDTYLKDTGSRVFAAVAPDKTAYLPDDSGYLTRDNDRLFELVKAGMPYASFVDLRGDLELGDYYLTDTHWRQEKILPAAKRLCEAMGVAAPAEEDFTVTALEKGFYGVYYGQAALPMEPETMYILESDWLDNCVVTNREAGKTSSVYDLSKLERRDLYDVFLSGAVSLLEIQNPAGQKGRELIVFRDSFGSSMIPLLIRDYERVTVIDIRYLSSNMLSQFVDFHGQDVLFLYSTLVLNSSSALK